jgi:hypothetical protein
MTDSDPSTKKRTTRAKPPERLTLADLDRIVLKSGGHDRRALNALCVMEAVAWLAGREHTDHPPCVSTTIGAFLRSWNDGMNDTDRQMLKPLIPRVIGTAGTPEQELQRSWMALDWYCRVSAPAWLRLAGLITEAEAIEATAPIIDSASAKAAQASLNTARDAAYKAGAAAGDAAWAAAWAAAGAAAGAKLRPTVETLQASAIDLVERMIAVTAVAQAPEAAS